MQIKTFSDRVLEIKKPGDEDKQLQKAKSLIPRLCKQFQDAETVELKMEINNAIKLAEWTSKQLQRYIIELYQLVSSNNQEGLVAFYQMALQAEGVFKNEGKILN